MKESSSAETLLAQADAAIDALQPDLALGLAERAIALEPSSPLAHFKRALACQTLGRFDDAEAGYRKVLALDPSSGKALNNLGCIHFMRHDRRAAREAFEKAVAADPSLAEPHSNLGHELLAHLMLGAGTHEADSARLIARVANAGGLARGDAVALEVAPGGLHLFGRDGRAL